jgi:hypothetical protein
VLIRSRVVHIYVGVLCCVGIFVPIVLVKMNLVTICPEHVCFISTMFISIVHDVLWIASMMLPW